MKSEYENILVKSIPYMEDGQIKSLGLENGTVHVYRYKNSKNITENIFKYNLNSYSKVLDEYYQTLNKYLEKNREIMMKFSCEESEFRKIRFKTYIYKVNLFIDFLLFILPFIVSIITGNLLLVGLSSICSLLGLGDAIFISKNELLKYIKKVNNCKQYLEYKDLEKQQNYNSKFVRKNAVNVYKKSPLKGKVAGKNCPKKRVKVL